MDLEIITKQIVKLSREVGDFIRQESNKFQVSDIKSKGVHNLVTYVDKESEKIIVSQLKTILPEAGFIAEEDQSLEMADTYNWVIDPLDGTTNYIHGLPPYSVSIALIEEGKPIIGVVFEVNLDECFYAWKNGGAYLNGGKIHVSETKKLADSLLATGFPYYDYSLLPKYMTLLSDLMQSTRGIRRLGSAAVDLAYIACGRFDLFYEYGLNAWDVAAGICIVEQAGGNVTDFNFGNNHVFGGELVASNKYTHNEFITKLNAHFK